MAHSPPAVRDAGDWLREQLASDHLRLCYRVSTGLERTGLVEGSDFAIEYRSTGDQIDRLPAIVADLVAAGSNPILMRGTGRSGRLALGAVSAGLAAISGSKPVHPGPIPPSSSQA